MKTLVSKVCIESLTIAGFRAYLDEQTFKLYEGKQAKSLAVFAPNAKGKSSLVDAIEFYFSEDGTLERLGKRQSVTQAGPDALANVGAKDKKIEPCISMSFREGTDKFGDSRDLSKAGMANLPDAAARVKSQCDATFIVRGYQLRQFVEDKTSQARYEDVSRWLMLSPLLEIQRNLRDLRLKLRHRTDNDPTLSERLRDLNRITGGKLKDWDDQAILDWVNETLIKHLDEKLKLVRLDPESDSYKEIKKRKKEEDDKIGLTSIEAAKTAVVELFGEETEDENSDVIEIGTIPKYEAAVTELIAATKKEQEEKTAAEKSAFKSLWDDALRILAESTDITDCPVCDTPFSASPHGSKDEVIVRISADLGTLKSYNEADQALKTATQTATSLHSSLRTKLQTASTMLEAAGYDKASTIIKEIGAYHDSLGEKTKEAAPTSTSIKDRLKKESNNLEKK